MKHEYKKHEKEVYGPTTQPQLISLEPMKYFTVVGAGNPNSEPFKKAIEALYAASYKVRMSPKKDKAPEGYFEYTIYPLEGFWSLTEKGVQEYQVDQKINKDELTFKIMIRQPEFVSEVYAAEVLKELKEDKGIDSVSYEVIEEGLSLQILHKGSYDTESASFEVMHKYCEEHGLERLSYDHKEVYLTDARRSKPENNKTILRIPVRKK